jgi:ethanolamine utilization protein EutQ (cupin superfamily)
MYKVVKASEGVIRQIADNKTANNLITKDIHPEMSLAITEATSYYEQETTPYNRIYYILEGELELTVDNVASKLRPGDACFISKDTTYEMRGTFKAVTVNQPAFGSKA